MAKGETERQMVQRHVRQGEAQVKRQHEIVTTLSEGGSPTEMAVTLLEHLQETLRLHKSHLARLGS